MATWIAHCRIADKLLEYGFEIAREPFLLGNLAPDVSQISKKITHCFDDDNGHIQPEDFYDSYLRDKNYDADSYAFALGCYVHLLADVEWIGNVWRPLKHDKPDLCRRIETDSEFAYQFKRLEYFGHDFLFLHDNPDYSSWKIIQKIVSIPTYLDILPGDVLLEWFNTEVKSNYDDEALLQQALTHEFPYLSKFDMQAWIDCCICTVVGMLKGKGISCPNPSPLWGDYILPYA